MARPIVLSNGELHVGINRYGMVHDFYFPYVGLENHSAGPNTRHKVGIWVDGQISWLDEPAWQLTFATADHALVGNLTARNELLGVLLEFDDFVDAHRNVFMRNVHVINLWDQSRQIRLFMHQAFVIGDRRSNTDTVQYLPDSEAILHYNGRRAFVVSGKDQHGQPFDQHSVGLFGIEGRQGTYRDADDGELQNGNVEHGRVDSTVRFLVELDGHSSTHIEYWVAVGTTLRETLINHRNMQEDGLQKKLISTITWWHNWLQPTFAYADKIPQKRRRQFIKSAMIIKSHSDKRGAVLASSDTTMLNYSRDAYGYCWPRDGAYAFWPLIRMGYVDEPQRYFEFCKRALHPSGYLMHKFSADGALGSSWHPYVHGNITAPPIQEDETALTVIVFAQFYHIQNDKKLLDEYYESFIKPMANFMASYIDETTGLPKPTYDLWEEVFLTTTYTVSTVYAGLAAAAELAEIANDSDSAVKWRAASDDIQTAAQKHLYNKERKAFYKGILADKGHISFNDTIDLSSFYGAFMYGLFPIHSEESQSTYQTIKNVFDVSNESPGVGRYEHDNYMRRDDATPANYWFITSLWLAQYACETKDLVTANNVLDWVDSQLDQTGMMAEQIHPPTGDFLSVSPLTWSHAEYISTVLDSMPQDPRDAS